MMLILFRSCREHPEDTGLKIEFLRDECRDEEVSILVKCTDELFFNGMVNNLN